MSLRSGRKYKSEDFPAVTQQSEHTGLYQNEETTSKFSKSAHSSRLSTASSLALKAHAKAEAARAKLLFAEKEASMIKQKAQLEADLHILQHQSAVAAASAEVAAYKEVELMESENVCREPAVPEQPVSSAERTETYVKQLSQIHLEKPLPKSKEMDMSKSQYCVSDCEQTRNRNVASQRECKEGSAQQSAGLPQAFTPEHQGIHDVTKYLIRREMVSSGFLKFDDHPENYWAWKSSFWNATKDIGLSDAEKLDLMIQWLGAESAAHAKRMRAVHVFNPSAGLNMAWQRLEEGYGTSEAVEHALLRKLETFPKLSNKDNLKLQELGDILLEIECAKEEGYLPGLSYLDTARGTNPIVEKLPYSLQEKWMSVGYRYKEDYGVAFPPFFVFSRFVRQQARMRNDPSFSFASSSQLTRTEKPPRYDQKTSVFVNKTNLSSEHLDCQNNNEVTNMEGPDKQCPIHRKPHPLKKCRSFRGKSIEERKSFLKENNICFRCCESTQHIARDCKSSIKCLECNSDKHIAALHPGPPPSPAESSEAGENYGREQCEDSASLVTAKCTEICGQTKSPRSCSKICLVKVYPTGNKEKAIKMYAVLDEQSNRSLAKSEFFDIFGIKTNTAPYTLKTCSGTMETSGRRAIGFTIESFDESIQLLLPTLTECDMIPDDKSEIPSPEIARYHPHLRSVVYQIPAVEHDTPILLLLGRDILSVHKARKQINGPYNAPYAQKLDLGWVIVGEVCSGTAHKPSVVNSFKTTVLGNGRTSFFSPCQNSITIKVSQHNDLLSLKRTEERDISISTDNLGSSVFNRTKDNHKQGLSVEDQAFLLQTKSHLTHKTSSTFMAEVMAIMTARPLVPVSADPDIPTVLTPAMPLTQKVNSLSSPSGSFTVTKLYKKRWKQVQCLADIFWKRWRTEYLHTLRSCRKWTQGWPNVNIGNVVLLQDSQVTRNKWPVRLIVNTLPGRDNKIRKVEVKVVKQGIAKVFLSPVLDIVLLFPEKT